MNLISRYIFREALGSSLLVMGVLLVILMSNQFALILNEAATDALPRETVLVVFGLTAIGYVTLIAPIALLLGLLLALARLNRDSEMAAWRRTRTATATTASARWLTTEVYDDRFW